MINIQEEPSRIMSNAKAELEQLASVQSICVDETERLRAFIADSKATIRKCNKVRLPALEKLAYEDSKSQIETTLDEIEQTIRSSVKPDMSKVLAAMSKKEGGAPIKSLSLILSTVENELVDA
ncbi:MAG: hypothetical protein V4438_02920, partial [Patescibacteria group bacterium]